MAKSATFGAIHIVVAFSIGYVLTGDVAVAGALTLVEPLANTVVHYLLDRWWEARPRPAAARPRAAQGRRPAIGPRPAWRA